jgi:hypothetical protein
MWVVRRRRAMVRRVRRRRVQEIDILFVDVFVWIFVITCVFDRLSLDILSRTRCDT